MDHWFSQDGSFPCLSPHVDSIFKDIYINSLRLLTILLLKDLYRPPIYSGLHTFCNPCWRCSWLTFSFKIWHFLPIFCLNCFITNCINLTMSLGTILFVHKLPYILLLVNLWPWYNNLGIYAMETIPNLLFHPKCFISVFEYFCLIFYYWNYNCLYYGHCTVHMADHINTLSKNVSDTHFTQ